MKSRTVKTLIMRVTPQLAKSWLEKSKQPNRRMNPQRVSYYAQSMRDGHWRINGSTIAFDKEGNLLDGQHRLRGLIEAAQPVEMLTVWGLDNASMTTIDTGRSRKLGDVLGIMGQTNTAALASALAMLNGYVMGYFGTGSMTLVDNDTMLGLFERHPKIADALYDGKRMAGKIGALPRSIIAAMYLTRLAAPRRAEEFEQGIATGADLAISDARLALLKIRPQVSRIRGDRERAIHNLAVYIKAWNAWIVDEQVHILRFGRDEKMPHVLRADGKPLKVT